MADEDDERRQGQRHSAWFPIRIDGDDLGEGMAIAKNVSEKGLLIASYQRFAVGAPVQLTLHLDPEQGEPRELWGTIVRLDRNEADPEGMWPYTLGVEFDDPDPELLAAIRAAAGLAD